MSSASAYLAAEVFDGHRLWAGAALLVSDCRVTAIVARNAVPDGYEVCDLGGVLIAPGFVDVQVNGGGGVLLNDDPCVGTVRTICSAHARFGTTSLMTTLITDRPELTRAALQTAACATAEAVPGFAGLHLEGPHLSLARKGAHDPTLIHAMSDADADEICAAKARTESIMVTLAPENVEPRLIRKLVERGVIVSLGHTAASYELAQSAVLAGASCVTHLFNAMSGLDHRAPGLAGAALGLGGLSAGLIADGIHVDPVMIGIALRAKLGPGKIFLVTDAMATIGTELQEFNLNGRVIRRNNGRLTLADGTLAGADLDMNAAVRFMIEKIGLPRAEALRMASLYPAMVLGRAQEIGVLTAGARADFVSLSPDLKVTATWIGGNCVHNRDA